MKVYNLERDEKGREGGGQVSHCTLLVANHRLHSCCDEDGFKQLEAAATAKIFVVKLHMLLYIYQQQQLKGSRLRTFAHTTTTRQTDDELLFVSSSSSSSNHNNNNNNMLLLVTTVNN